MCNLTGLSKRKTMLAFKEVVTDLVDKKLVTLPAESGQEDKVISLIKKWGADAIRDSDGTVLSDELRSLGLDIYSTICLVRTDQKWAKENKDCLPMKFLMSNPKAAEKSTLEIDPMENYFRKKYKININYDPKKYWQVFNRTTGQEVSIDTWDFDKITGKVTVKEIQAYHLYTVNFMVDQVWDSVSMYNHLLNNWTIDPIISVDPFTEKAYHHLMTYFDKWIESHSDTDIVRLTTLAYNFTIDSNEYGKDRYRDWLGYTDCISPELLDAFEKVKGYRLTSEDIVDQGCYNATCKVPGKKYLDWMDFIQTFVHRFGKELVEKIHKAGKKAAIFWGDHWIGVEPYGDKYPDIGIDINVGACEDGVALRRLADCPGQHTKEIRLYPYFFPDVFAPGGNPLAESTSNWVKIRRAMLRKPVDRIGYGGYLSLAAKFPDFIDHVEDICNEFRSILNNGNKTKPYTAPIKVGILSAWGKLRSWINTVSPMQKFHVGRDDVTEITGSNMLECLSGLPVDVIFISFEDIKNNGIPHDINVIINDGSAGTSWSGGEYWKYPDVVSKVRKWVHDGGAFIGVGDPSAHLHQGRFFQLSDILGVQKEVGLTIEHIAMKKDIAQNHFILNDSFDQIDTAVTESYVYPSEKSVEIIAKSKLGHTLIASNKYGMGRAVYFAGLPYSLQNCRLLHRSLFWATSNEKKFHQYYSLNLNTECAYYPETEFLAVINNSSESQTTKIFDADQNSLEVVIKPFELKWFK